MASNVVITVEVGASSARIAESSNGEVDVIRLEPAALDSSGGWLVGTEAADQIRMTPDSGVMTYLDRIGDAVPLYVAGQTWAPQDILASVLRPRLPQDAQLSVRVVLPAEWGSYRHTLVRAALEEHDITTACVGATEASLAATDAIIPDAASRVLIVDANDTRMSATMAVRPDETVDELGDADDRAPWRITAIASHEFGGTDIDEALLTFVTDRVPSPGDATAAQQLRDNCRTARQRLATQPVAEVEVPVTGERLRLVREDLDVLTGLQLRTALAGMLLRVGVAIDDGDERPPLMQTTHSVDFVLFTGDLAYLPLAVETLSQLLDLPVHVPSAPELVAVRGAAAMDLMPSTEEHGVAERELPNEPTRKRVPWAVLRDFQLIPSRRTMAVMAAALALVVALPLGARALPDDIASVLSGIGNGTTGRILGDAPMAQAATVEADWVTEATSEGASIAAVPAGGKISPWMIGTLKGEVTRGSPSVGERRATATGGIQSPSPSKEPATDEPVAVQGVRTAIEPSRTPQPQADKTTKPKPASAGRTASDGASVQESKTPPAQRPQSTASQPAQPSTPPRASATQPVASAAPTSIAPPAETIPDEPAPEPPPVTSAVPEPESPVSVASQTETIAETDPIADPQPGAGEDSGNEQL